MSVLAKTPIAYCSVDSLSEVIAQLNERIRRRAFEYYVERGLMDGCDQSDWFCAERELIAKPNVCLTSFDQDFIIDIDLPEVRPDQVLLFVAPQAIAVSTRPDQEGRQAFRIIPLPETVDTTTVDAEFSSDNLRIAVMRNNALRQGVSF